MKKNLLIALLLILSAAHIRADLVWYEGYNYPDGRIDVTSTNGSGTNCNWLRHSGSGNDAIVTNHMEQVSATGGTPITRQDDVHRNLTNNLTVYTNSAMAMYSSMTIIVTSLPGGTNQGYFAHFMNGTSLFYGKLLCTNGVQPGTYRLGVSGSASIISALYPVDLLTNVPYQVVVEYDAAVNRQATLWVNPLGVSDFSVSSSDVVSSQSNLMSYAFRQASTFGNFFCSLTNLAVATTFDEAATNIASPTPVAPTIVRPLVGFTNFVSVSNALTVLAAGQSMPNMTYQWQLNGVNISSLPDGSPAGNTNLLSFPNPTTNDSGSYSVVITTPSTGLSVTSAAVGVSVTFAPVPPTFTSQPTNVTLYPGQTANFSVSATGPGPISFQWNFNSSPISGANNPTLSIPNVQTNNGTVGVYECDIINSFGTNHSSNATVTVIIPPVVTINYIRGLVDPVFFLPTNTTLYYTVTGTVISKTNFTTAANDEFFITDGTGSICVFYGGASTFRPSFGDVVTVTGPISGAFNSLLEFNLSVSDPSMTVTTVSTGNPAPLGTVLPLSFTNSPSFGGVSNALRLYGGSLAVFTNITITPGGGSNTFTSSGSYTLTDGTGASLTLFVYSGFSGLISNAVPSFCYTITGVLSEFLSGTAPDRSSGYQLEVSDPNDFVTVPPPAVTVAEATKGALTWTAVPYNYSYSVYSATNVAGPYLPLKTGLLFATSAGSYTDTNVSSTTKYYRVTTP
jgi:Immunoglobulin domain